jgi:hypothetical protein
MLYCVARCYAGAAQVSLTVSALTQDKKKKKKVHRVGFEYSIYMTATTTCYHAASVHMML